MGGKLKKMLWPVVVTVLAAGFSTWGYLKAPAFLEILELKSYDLRFQTRGERPVSGHVAIVAIDENSIKRVGRWPWSREVMAGLIKDMDAAAPKAVGYDIGFFDAQEKPAQKELIRLLQNAKTLGLRPTKELKAYFKDRLGATDPDGVLARALAGCSSPQILGYYFTLGEEGENPETPSPDAKASLDTASKYLVQKAVDGASADQVKIPVPHAVRVRPNIEPLAHAAGSQAYFNVIPDPDGTVRRYTMALEYQGGYFQPLAAGLFSSAVPKGLPTMLVTRHGMVGVEWEQHIAPTNAKGRMMINYRGPAQSIPHIPAWKILEGKYPKEELAGKYLLVGVTAPAVFDMRVTPVGVAYPGVEIHATALDSMLHQDFLLRPSWAPLFDIAAIWTLALACMVFLWWAKPVFTLAGYAGVSFGYVWLNLYFFGTKQFWLSLIYPLLSFTLNYLALNIYRFVFSDRQKKQIRSAFGKYLDESVVEQVVSDPDKLKLGGENLELSVLFSDIRGFTGFSEKLDPEQLVATLNEYFTGMTEVVLKNKGLLDKYIGDAVMAVFGAPLSYPEHAEAACRTALEMTARLEDLNARFTSQGLPPLRMGVGVNTGEAVAGNMGSEQRFSYTVMGKNVNLASRLEGLTKLYGVKIIISADTQKKVGELFWTRPLDVVVPAGADEAVEIFELLAPISEPKPLDYMGDYLKMIETYREGAFERALETVEGLAARHPEDNVLSVYRERILEFHENPPQDWNGVHVCTGK